jgi:hypothetical protein
MITVAFTVSCRRPRYLRRTLESWARCRGEAQFLFSMEPASREFGLGQFVHWARSVLGDVKVVGSHERLGCNRNTYKALDEGFRQSEFTVLAEEDIEVASDALEYFTWASQEYRGDPQVLAVCAHVKEGGQGACVEGVARAPWFSPLVWGTWQAKWEALLEPGWRQCPDSWDAHVRTVCAERSLCCVFPDMSRAVHFGENSTQMPRQANGDPNYFHRQALSQCYRPHYEPQPYREGGIPRGTVLY